MKRFLPTQPLIGITIATLCLTACPWVFRAQATNRLFKRPKPPTTPPIAGPIVAPVGRGGGIVCPNTPLPLITLTPEQRVPNPSSAAPLIQVWGKMTAANPTLWFYMPYDNKGLLKASFVLDGKEQPVALPNKAGFIPVSLRDVDQAQLKVGRSYLWSLTVQCGLQPTVSGWVEWAEVDPLKLKRIKAAKPAQQAVTYAQEGIWYDAVNILAIQRFQKPQDANVNQLWQQLLVDLSDPKAPASQREFTEKVVGQPIVRLPK
jgi:Domain of Unknown Function (DUF928)